MTYTNVKPAEGFAELCSRLEASAAQKHLLARVFFLAIPPKAYAGTVHALQAACTGPVAPVFLLEKPFGQDASSAAELMERLLSVAPPHQLLLVDHYLGKAPLQAVPHFRRCAGAGLLAGWDGEVRGVSVSMLEQQDVQGRTWFYEGVGVVRDVMQNHATEMALAWAAPLPTATRTVSASGVAEWEEHGAYSAASMGRGAAVQEMACALGFPGDSCAEVPPTSAPVQAARLPYSADKASWYAHASLNCSILHAAIESASEVADAELACVERDTQHPAVSVLSGQYRDYPAHVREQQGESPRRFTPTAARVVLSMPRGESTFSAAFTAGKALGRRLSSTTAHLQSGGSVSLVLNGALRLANGSTMHGPALALQGPIPGLQALPGGWAIVAACDNVARTCQTLPQDSHKGHMLGKECYASDAGLDGDHTWVLCPVGTSGHRRALPACSGIQCFQSYLDTHAQDALAGGAGALGSIQAYANLLAAALAGDGGWFVHPTAELPALWALWDPIIAATERGQ